MQVKEDTNNTFLCGYCHFFKNKIYLSICAAKNEIRLRNTGKHMENIMNNISNTLTQEPEIN